MDHALQVKRLIETDRHGFLMLPLLGRACSDLLRFRPVGHDLDDYAGIICISTLSAIAGLAMLGWCHGDVKPANIMLPTHKVRQACAECRVGWCEPWCLPLPLRALCDSLVTFRFLLQGIAPPALCDCWAWDEPHVAWPPPAHSILCRAAVQRSLTSRPASATGKLSLRSHPPLQWACSHARPPSNGRTFAYTIRAEHALLCLQKQWQTDN